MRRVVGYIKLSESENLHFVVPVFKKEFEKELEIAVLDKESQRISSFISFSQRDYKEIDCDQTVEEGDLYLYIYLFKDNYHIGNYFEIAANLTLMAHLDMLKNVEKYELYSLLDLYNETRKAAKNYSEELNVSFIDENSFTFPELETVKREEAWNAIQHYGELLSHCKNSLFLDQILKIHSDNIICLGRYLIAVQDVYQLYKDYGHLTKDHSHDLLIYLAHSSNLDEELSNDPNYKLYRYFEISTASLSSIKQNPVLAINSQSSILTGDNAVLMSRDTDLYLSEKNKEGKDPNTESDIDDLVLEISKSVLIADEL